MKLDSETIMMLAGFADEAENYKPFVKSVIKIIRSYAGEFEGELKDLTKWIRDNRIAGIAQYEEAGFSRTEALLMTIDDSASLRSLINDIKTK